MARVHWVDWLVVAILLALVLGIGVLSTVIVQRRTRERHGADAFFLASRATTWWVVGASIFASNIGTENFIGQSGGAAASGMAIGLYEWTASYLLVLLGWFFAPVYLGCLLTTIPEYAELRFNPACRVVLVTVSLISYIITKLAGALFSSTVVLKVVFGWSMWESVPIILVLAGLYEIGGGLLADMLTDTVQMMVFTAGGLVGLGISLSRVGGMSSIRHIMVDVASKPYFTHSLRSPEDKAYPWPGMFIGQMISSTWYWCVDQELTQRVLASKGINTARTGCLLAGFLKIIPVFVIVIPGMAARALHEACLAVQDGRATAEEVPFREEWCDVRLDEGSESNKAYPELVLREFPRGLVGLMIASFLMAVLSSLDSVFNSAATMWTHDVHRRFINPRATQLQLVRMGRLVTAVIVGLGVAWMPVIEGQQRQLYQVTQSAQTHVAPSLATVMIIGFIWKRANGCGGLAGMLVGTVLGLVRLGLSFS
ncbi:unnamed protein product, partial [Discosporangium mesarthrocarpum]